MYAGQVNHPVIPPRQKKKQKRKDATTIWTEHWGLRAMKRKNLQPVQQNEASRVSQNPSFFPKAFSFPMVSNPEALELMKTVHRETKKGEAVPANSRCWSILQGAGSRLGTDVWRREGAWQSGAEWWSVWLGR